MEIALLYDIGIIIVVVTFISIIAKILKQPLIPAYIFGGILTGPEVFKLITNQDLISTLSEIGIALLLFIVGMEMDFSKLKNIGLIASLGTFLQLVITSLVGFFLTYVLGFNFMDALYISLGIAFSSTMIVVKLLSDKDRLDTLSGRVSLGILLIQDVFVVLVMSFLENIYSLNISLISETVFKAFGLFSIAVVLNKYVFPSLLKRIVKDKELFFLFALSICFLYASLAYLLGFSIAIGGFLAGISLAVFPYNLDISSRVKSLRDFFTILFFASLGMSISFSGFSNYILALVVLSLFAIIGKFIILFFVSTFFGYKRRVSIFTALNLSNVSEFSLILVSAGVSKGMISGEISTLMTMIVLITITLASYTIKYDEKIYSKLYPLFNFASKYKIIPQMFDMSNIEEVKENLHKHIIVVGAHTMGQTIIKRLKDEGAKFVVLDYNPEIVKKLIDEKIYSIYGDMNHFDVLDELNIKSAKLVISTVPRFEDNSLFLERVKLMNPKIKVIMTSSDVKDAIKLYNLGADFVIIPKLISAERISNYMKTIVEEGDESILDKLRNQEIKFLERKVEEEYIELYGPEFLKELKEKIEKS